LILGGLMTDSCVAFTANDAYLRNFRIFVPSDCSASLTQRRHGNALAQMRNTLKADTRPAARLDLKRIAKA
jgi:nicotinamidase-related amidase